MENFPYQCNLCGNSNINLTFSAQGRDFIECANCDLLFVDARYHLNEKDEKARYDLHNNNYGDNGYREFLLRLKGSLVPFLTPGMKGLDFGCGPSDVLTKLFVEDGFSMDRFDPFFAPIALTDGAYDFIACAEVVEHFRDSHADFKKMRSLIRIGGWLAIMTQLRDSFRNDPTWWYLRDKTHICFYSSRTFEWIEAKFDLKIHSRSSSVFVMSG